MRIGVESMIHNNGDSSRDSIFIRFLNAGSSELIQITTKKDEIVFECDLTAWEIVKQFISRAAYKSVFEHGNFKIFFKEENAGYIFNKSSDMLVVFSTKDLQYLVDVGGYLIKKPKSRHFG